MVVNKERIVNSFVEMARISSPSKEERKMADYLLEDMNSLGLEVYEDDCSEKIGSNAGNIIVRIPGNKNKKVLFSAHMDTVSPCESVNPIIEGNIIKSDGTTVLGADNKAGIAAIVEMVKVIKENNLEHPEIIIVFSVAEETGLHGAKNVDLSKFGKIDHGYILDAGGKPGLCFNQAPYSAKGVYEIIGRESHAGSEPEKGVNAFVVASDAINKLKIGRVDENTTCNIGVVQGGIATNIVMPSLNMVFEARSLYEDKLDSLLAKVDETFRESCEKYSAKFINNVTRGTAGFNIPEHEETIKIFKTSTEKLGLKYEALASGSASDTNIYNRNNISSLNIGIGMTNIHTKEEYIEIEDLVNTTKLLLAIIEEI